jgi:hypothetical protein
MLAPQPYRDAIQRELIARPDLSYLAQLLAMADTDKVVLAPFTACDSRHRGVRLPTLKKLAGRARAPAVYSNSRVVRVLETRPGARLSVRGTWLQAHPGGFDLRPRHTRFPGVSSLTAKP